jgi:hypothetical protein
MKKIWMLLVLVPLLAAYAQQPWNCSAPEFRQFDFWVGNWEVRDASGSAVIGQNRIERIHGGCALQETWTGAPGDTGTSLNTYYPPEKKWHQVWVSNNGAFLRISGEFKDSKMILIGESVRPGAGARVLNRVTWSLVDGNPDKVRQLWEVSTNGGTSWQVDFDGLYIRKK